MTKGGLVFHAGGDGKVRAYDEDTGKVLWTGTFRGSTSGVPVSYERRAGSTSSCRQRRRWPRRRRRGGRGGARDATRPDAPPTGMIAFALPRK